MSIPHRSTKPIWLRREKRRLSGRTSTKRTHRHVEKFQPGCSLTSAGARFRADAQERSSLCCIGVSAQNIFSTPFSFEMKQRRYIPPTYFCTSGAAGPRRERSGHIFLRKAGREAGSCTEVMQSFHDGIRGFTETLEDLFQRRSQQHQRRVQRSRCAGLVYQR